MSNLQIIGLCLFACGLLTAADPVAPAELTGTPDGSLHLFMAGAEVGSLTPCIADAGWRFNWPAAVEVPTDAAFRFTLKLGKDSVPGEVQTSVGTDGAADVAWSFTAPTDIAFNGLSVNSEFSVAALAGGTWDVDGKHGEFPRSFSGSPGVFGGEARNLAIAFPDGRRVSFAFAQPTFVTLQDNRKWGGPTFAVRLGKGIGKLAAKERYDLAMRIAVTQGLTYRRDLPVSLAAGDEWIPLHTEQDIVAGSALDLSGAGLTDGPCGAKGRIIATPDGHFACADEPGKSKRFYGVNLCFSALYLSKEHVDQLLDRLVRLGYNTVRVHHYEYRLTTTDWKPGFEWSPEHVDQLDYLMAGCAKRGLWLTTDLYVSRPVPGKQVGLTGDAPDPGRFKLLVPVHEPSYQDWATFARKFLDRVNPYTGKRVAEEPALAWISLINEGPVAGGWDGAKRIPEWTTAWNRWLKKTYAERSALDVALGDLGDNEDPASGTVILPESLTSGTRRARACQVFLADTEAAMVARMRTFLRDELKCPALLTDLNCGPNLVPMQAARTTFDYVDDHFYVDHPSFLDQQWHLPSRCPNTNPIRDGAPGGRSSAALRLWGKPFAISEFDYSGPGRFRGVGGVLTGALGALQDWDAVWRFAYGHKDTDMFAPAPIDYFNLANDPLNQAADRAAVLLYLRRDLQTAPSRVGVVMPRDQLRNPPGKLALTGTEAFAWTTRIGGIVVDDPATVPRDLVAVPLAQGGDRDAVAALLRERHLLSDGDDRVTRSETGEITIDRALGVLTIDTPRTAGGYADPGQAISATKAGVRVEGLTNGATVFVSSLGMTPIRSAPRLLVTHLTDLQNTGAKYAESARQTLLAWGTLPHLVRAGEAKVSIALAEPAAYQVWALSTSGRRVERVAAVVAGDVLTFTARVKGTDGACMLYEVTK